MSESTFHPVVHGFHFSNNDIQWSWGPFSGTALCGGMIYAALDYFYTGMSIPVDTAAPAEGTNLQEYILDRQWTAHANTIPKFAGAYLSDFMQNLKESMPKVAELEAKIASGRPVVLCLTGISKGHHVLAIGCTSGPNPEIRFYDPNFQHTVSRLTLTETTKRWRHSVSGQYWYGFFFDESYSRKIPPALCGEVNWRWCPKCEGLFWDGDPNKGKCPAGGNHAAGGVRNYILPINSGNGQGDWKWCSKCQGLFFAGHGAGGACPAGGGHDISDKNVYFMPQNTGAGEPNWRWCRKCEGMFWAGNPAKGVCPASGAHDMAGSGNYSLMATNVVG